MTERIPRERNAWIKGGFAPQNASLHKAGSDGTDIGAVAYQAGAASAFATYRGRHYYVRHLDVKLRCRSVYYCE